MPLQELCIQGNIQLLSNCLGIHCFTDQQQFLALHVCDCMCVVSKEIKEKQATMRWTQTYFNLIILLIDRTLHSPQLNE
mgnify:CR=1 FL=1